MQMPKPTDEDKDRFRAMVDPLAGVEVKPMFGNLGAFVNGNMFAGLLGSAVGVKLGEAALTELRELPGTGPFGPGDKPMGGVCRAAAGPARGRGPEVAGPRPIVRRDLAA